MDRESSHNDLWTWLESTDPVLELRGRASVGELLAVLQERGFDARVVELELYSGKAELLEALHRILDLGEWFGFNWDALEEALYGSEEDESADRVLVCSGFERFQSRASADAEMFLDILRTVASIPESGLRGCILIP